MLNKAKYITINELAEMLGISTSLIFKMQREGRDLPPCVSFGDRCKRFRKEKVDAWLLAKEKKCEADPTMKKLGEKGGRPSSIQHKKGKTKKERVEERLAGLAK